MTPPVTHWPPSADGCRGWPLKGLQVRRAEGRGESARPFDGRRQLIVYRAFYGPEVTTYAEGGAYPERACVGCSLVADQIGTRPT